MTVHQARRDELDPTVRHSRLPARAAGTARYGRNWGWQLCQRLLGAAKPVPHAAERRRLWKAERPRRCWGHGASPCCGQEALRDLDRACANFWRGRKEGRRVGLARQHGRRDACRPTGGIPIPARSVTPPRQGCVRTNETTEKFRGRILGQPRGGAGVWVPGGGAGARRSAARGRAGGGERVGPPVPGAGIRWGAAGIPQASGHEHRMVKPTAAQQESPKRKLAARAAGSKRP